MRAEVADRDLGQIADAAALDAFVADVLAAHPDELAKFAAGAGQLRKLFLGKAMAASRGRADQASASASRAPQVHSRWRQLCVSQMWKLFPEVAAAR